MEDKIREFFAKYAAGKAEEKEQKAIDEFFNQSQKDGLSSDKVYQDEMLKARLSKSVFQQTIYKERSKRRAMLVAAVGALAIVANVAIFFLNRTPDMTQVISHNGEQLKVLLPDSSAVYLNSGSTLSYVQDMASEEERVIHLMGEAYFEVKRNPSKPFIVKSEHMNTRVLGTRFVVSDYAGEGPSVTVRSGKVGVDNLNTSEGVILTKDQRVYYQNNKTITASVNAKDYYSWKDGKIVFDQADLNQVVSTLNRRFSKVKIHLSNPADQQLLITGSYYDDNIESVLRSLSFIYGVQYSIESNGQIYLKIND
ncbi:FecR family protein [Fulvivirga ligni]|uniref:FecR family protein n=1 Tax=Fulvivirga ligni TaxID=2904246 RepID=UPI001F29B657|nr:FecR domain-containing protein [Fulvivirga ligni]UII24031.1 FecR domain-containing protein [Fulvivirga ligni]